MIWVHHDGGRTAAGLTGKAGDCAARALSIAALGVDYRAACDLITQHADADPWPRSCPERGVFVRHMHSILRELGWTWVPTMRVGQGCTVHLRADELPSGRLIVRLSRHYAAVVDGVVYDNHDPRRDGTRCVYGYWTEGVR